VAAGSFAKPAGVDAAYFFEKVEPFSRDVSGLVEITVRSPLTCSCPRHERSAKCDLSFST
jgi:hypothetical protein